MIMQNSEIDNYIENFIIEIYKILQNVSFIVDY